VPGERDRLGVLVEVDEPVADLDRLDRGVVEALGREGVARDVEVGRVSKAPAVGATARQSAAATAAATPRTERRRRREAAVTRSTLSLGPVGGPGAKRAVRATGTME
jgi:hypothetical protein